MRLILVSGQSGSGKSIALKFLEDLGFFCVDNLPMILLDDLLALHQSAGIHNLAISVDTRSSRQFDRLPAKISALKHQDIDVDCLFLKASVPVLVQRFSETRRRHPLSNEHTTLEEAIACEIELLYPLRECFHCIDTSDLPVPTLRQFIKLWLDAKLAPVSLVFESFGFKYGVPLDADFVFDVRFLPNPHYDKVLRPLTGLDQPVQDFFADKTPVWLMIEQIEAHLNFCLPYFQSENRSYLTIAVGCTGGQHRSVFVCQNLVQKFAGLNAQVRHRQLGFSYQKLFIK